jgi:hypothetical protein
MLAGCCTTRARMEIAETRPGREGRAEGKIGRVWIELLSRAHKLHSLSRKGYRENFRSDFFDRLKIFGIFTCPPNGMPHDDLR